MNTPLPQHEERDTDRPEFDAGPKPELSDQTMLNLRFEAVMKAQRETDSKVTDLYALLMGATPSGRPSPSGKGGVGQAFHDQGNTLSVIAGNVEAMASAFESLPKQVAIEVANKFAALYQKELTEIKRRLTALEEHTGATP